MFDYEKIGFTKVGEKTTPLGMTQAKYEGKMNDGKTTYTKLVSEFSDEHPMYKKYGVREMQVDKFPRNRIYQLKADAFGQRIEFQPSLWDKKPTNDAIAEMLKRLKRAVNYKQTSFLENLVEIAKHIKK